MDSHSLVCAQSGSKSFDLKHDEGWMKIPFLLTEVNTLFIDIVYPAAKARKNEIIEKKRNLDMADKPAWTFIDNLFNKMEKQEKFNIWIKDPKLDITLDCCSDKILSECTRAAHFLSNIRDWLITFDEDVREVFNVAHRRYEVDQSTENAEKINEVKEILMRFTFACPRRMGDQVDQIAEWAKNVFNAILKVKDEFPLFIAGPKSFEATRCLAFEQGTRNRNLINGNIVNRLPYPVRMHIYSFLYPVKKPSYQFARFVYFKSLAPVLKSEELKQLTSLIKKTDESDEESKKQFELSKAKIFP